MAVPSSGQENLRSGDSATPHSTSTRFANSIEQALRPVSVCSGANNRHVPDDLLLPLLPRREISAGLTPPSHPESHTHTDAHAHAQVIPPLPPHPHQHPRRQPPPARLREKPKSLSIAVSHARSLPPVEQHAPMRRLSGISKTLSFSSFHSQSPSHASEPKAEEPRPSSSHSTHPPSTPLLRAQSSGSIIRSPSQKKKPPASHSSYGVETTLGPPPSYSTQRTLSEDRVWSVNRTSSSRTVTSTTAPERVIPQLNEGSQGQPPSQAQSLPAREDRLTALPLPLPRSSDPDVSSPETIDTQATPQDGSDMTPPTSAGGTNVPDDTDRAAKGLGLDGAHDDDVKASSSDETHKSEDLFLNIARTDASHMQQPSSKTERRRSRISLPFFSNPRPATGIKSSPMATQFEAEHLAPRPEEPRRFGKRSSLGQHVPGAFSSAQYFDDSRSHVSRAVEERSHAGSVTGRSDVRSRRHSNANVDTLRPPTRSYTSRTNRLVSESLHGDRIKAAEQPATESTISTTAPSTVWDELDDLKSRIRKLELTGKLPPSSAAAMATTERPRTATTQATTMSSSPKHKTPLSTLPSQIEGISSTVHPLLHEALSNAKAVVSNEIYQKLQATAQDALQLSAMMNLEGYSGPNSAMSPTNERQIRRRTESMCRSLTELAIAMLADPKGVNEPVQRPGSRDTFAQPSSGIRSRRLSNEPSERPLVASRVQSRLDSRRTSLHMAQTQSPSTTHPSTAFETPPPLATVASGSSRLPRSATLVRHRRTPSFVDGTNDDDEASPALRPVSRAQTDVNIAPSSSYRSLARDRATFSRQYTKQHPLPKSHIASQQVEVPTPTASSRTPLTTNVNIVSRRNVSHTTAATPQSAPPQTIFHRQPSDQDSSPFTPSYSLSKSHMQRPPFTISIERHNAASAIESPTTALPVTPDSIPIPASSTGSVRQSSTRRSLGFASRLSNVSSRLKAARAERQANTSASRSPPRDGENDGASIMTMEQEPSHAGMPVPVPVPVSLSGRIGGAGADGIEGTSRRAGESS